MENLIKYTLLLAADLVILGCIVHFFVKTFSGHLPFKELGSSEFSTMSKLEQVKALSYFTLVVLAVNLTLYGGLDFLFSWMPHRWVFLYESDDPYEERYLRIATWLSVTGAFVGSMLLTTFLAKTADKISNFQLRESKAKAFRNLIVQELDQPETTADKFAKLEREIEHAEFSRMINYEDAYVFRRLVGTFREAMSGKAQS